MTPIEKAAKHIERDAKALNFRLAVAVAKIRASASIAVDEAMHALGQQALTDARAANRLARDTIAALF